MYVEFGTNLANAYKIEQSLAEISPKVAQKIHHSQALFAAPGSDPDRRHPEPVEPEARRGLAVHEGRGVANDLVPDAVVRRQPEADDGERAGVPPEGQQNWQTANNFANSII